MPIAKTANRPTETPAPAFKASLAQEIIIRRLNEIGVMAEIARSVAEKGISILAITAWVEDADGVVHLLTDDNLRAKEALQKKGFDAREGRVIVVEAPHKPGMLKHMTERLRDERIDIHHLYATGPIDSERCLIVFASADNDRALVAINKVGAS